MTRNLRKRLLILLGCVALLLGNIGPALGQFARSRRVRVYHPGSYHRTRTAMSRRAALRKILKKKRHRAAQRRRHTH